MTDCLFCKIAAREIESTVFYEDEKVIAIKDIDPKAPVHAIIIPKRHFATMNQVEDYSIYTDIFKAISVLTKDFNIRERGYRVVANCNSDGDQTILHMHFHLLGGRKLLWPPG